jgi:hypothetical protein
MANNHLYKKIKLYEALLQFSTLQHHPDYQTFSHDNAKIVFSEYKIMNYYNKDVSGILRIEEYIETDGVVLTSELKHFMYKLAEYRLKYKRGGGVVASCSIPHAERYDHCSCTTAIYHCYIIKNRINNNVIDPIGCDCIFYFCDDAIKRSLKKFTKLLTSDLFMCLVCKELNVKKEYSLCKNCKPVEHNKEKLENDMMGCEDHRTIYKDVKMNFGKYKFQPVRTMSRNLGYCTWLLSVSDIMEKNPYLHKFLILNNHGLL